MRVFGSSLLVVAFSISLPPAVLPGPGPAVARAEGASDSRLDAAAAALAAGDAARAAALCEEILAGAPRDAGALVLLSKVALQGGDLLSAENRLDDAVSAGGGPDRGRLLLALGLVRLARGQSLAMDNRGTRSTLVALFRDAVRALEAAREAGEDGDEVVLGLAEAHEWAEQADLSERTLRDALAAGRDSSPVRCALVLLLSRQPGRAAEARAAAREFLDRAAREEDRIAVRLALGRMELASGDVDRAFEAYAAVLEASPSLQALYDDAWAATAERSRFDLLDRLLSLVMARFPGDPKAAYYRGHVRFRENRLTEAAADFEGALRLEPEFREALLGLAEARRRQGRRLEAAALLDRVLSGQPGDVTALDALRGVAGEIALSGDDESARRLFERLVRERPEDRETRVNWAVACARTGRLDEARSILAAGIALDPGDGRLRNELGIACENARDLASAEREYRAALDAGWNFDAAENLAFLFIRTGRRDEALRLWVEILRRDPVRIRSAIAYEQATRS